MNLELLRTSLFRLEDSLVTILFLYWQIFDFAISKDWEHWQSLLLFFPCDFLCQAPLFYWNCLPHYDFYLLNVDSKAEKEILNWKILYSYFMPEFSFFKWKILISCIINLTYHWTKQDIPDKLFSAIHITKLG